MIYQLQWLRDYYNLSRKTNNKSLDRMYYFVDMPRSLESDGQNIIMMTSQSKALQWRHNGRHSVSNHQPHECLLNCLFRRRRKKTSKLRVTGLCVSTVNSPQKWPVTRKMFPFGDVIMYFNIIHLAINRTLSMAGYEISENSSISCVFILWWYVYWVMPNIGFSIWISNHIHAKLWGVISYWCPNFKWRVILIAIGIIADFNILRPSQNGPYFPDDISICIFLDENTSISIKIWLKFVPKDPISNSPPLVQIIAWNRTVDRPLSETMLP